MAEWTTRFWVCVAALALGSGCGGGDDSSGASPAPASASVSPSPSASAPITPTETTPTPAAAGGLTYYFSDCASGAAAGCIPGDDAQAGTSESAPKRSFAGLNVDALPAGSRLLFKRGGAWDWTTMRLANMNATAQAPLVFDAFGSGPLPLLRVATSLGFEFGTWQNNSDDHGYVFRNLKLDGLGTGQWGIWLRGRLSEVTIEHMEITGFLIAINSQGDDPISRVSLLNNLIHGNRQMGVLGNYHQSRIVGNEFRGNNFSGSGFNHGLYVSSNNHVTTDLEIRGNSFIDNSVVNGRCMGGNLTLHGRYDRLQIVGNVISVPAATETCYGVSATSGYAPAPNFPSEPEFFRNMVIADNVITELGGCSICTNSAPGAVIERNKIFKTQNAYTQGVAIGAHENDLPGGGEVVRDNVACLTFAQHVAAFPTNGVNNIVRIGADASTGPCAR